MVSEEMFHENTRGRKKIEIISLIPHEVEQIQAENFYLVIRLDQRRGNTRGKTIGGLVLY